MQSGYKYKSLVKSAVLVFQKLHICEKVYFDQLLDFPILLLLFLHTEQGVPQGGVLSTTLFSIKINDIVKCLGNLTDCSLYVDDFCICYRSKSMATIERQLQQNLNKIENWATSNGFQFSKSKTQCVHFCQLRKQHDDPVLHLQVNLVISKSKGMEKILRVIRSST